MKKEYYHVNCILPTGVCLCSTVQNPSCEHCGWNKAEAARRKSLPLKPNRLSKHVGGKA